MLIIRKSNCIYTAFGIVTLGADKERLDVPGSVFSFFSGEEVHQRKKRRPNQEHLVFLCLHQKWRYQMLCVCVCVYIYIYIYTHTHTHTHTHTQF